MLIEDMAAVWRAVFVLLAAVAVSELVELAVVLRRKGKSAS